MPTRETLRSYGGDRGQTPRAGCARFQRTCGRTRMALCGLGQARLVGSHARTPHLTALRRPGILDTRATGESNRCPQA